MKKLSLLFLLFSYLQISAQGIADYKERRHPFIMDSTLLDQKYDISATEGIIHPEEYILAPGDKIFISIKGMEEVSVNAVINHEGFLYIPNVGGIDLTNTNLSDGKKRIIEQINKYYKNVDIFISLYDFRKIKVSLIGDVKKPSTYVVSGNSRLVDLVMISEGFNETSDLRNIRILHSSGKENSYDFLSFLRLGDKNKNPLLREGDAVLISKVDKTVSITGEVMYPGSYEFIEGETAGDLIRLAGGLLTKAKTDTIEIVSFTGDDINQKSKYYPYDELLSENLLLKNKDHVMVRGIPDYLEEKYIVIIGKVKYPGYYKVMENRTKLTEVIDEAGGFTDDASLNEATLFRQAGSEEKDPEFERLKIIPRADMTEDEYDYLKAKSRQRKGNVVVDFVKLFDENIYAEDVILKNGDVITIPEIKNFVIIIGQVINPGNIIFSKGLTYQDYIDLAGGYGWRALENEVRIVKANTGEWIDADDDIVLEPGDTIWIPENPPGPKFWDVFMNTLTILGQVAAVIAAVVAVIAISR